jgi:pimeloyl-ACP methyl ester carboxylesterase
VIALDLCGYGDNEGKGAKAPFTLDEEVRLVMATLDRLVEPHVRIHVVGHSYGGLVALRLAQSRRGRVASLSLYEPVVFRALDDTDPDAMGIKLLSNRLERQIAAGRHRDAARIFLDFWSGDGSYESLPLHARASIARRVDKVPLDFQAAWHWPRDVSELGAIITPTLLMSGDRSPVLVQRIATVLARKLPNCRVRRFGSGHMGPITDAALINPWIESFLQLCVERDAASASLCAVPWKLPIRSRFLAATTSGELK